jgi:hypothetical protein
MPACVRGRLQQPWKTGYARAYDCPESTNSNHTGKHEYSAGTAGDKSPAACQFISYNEPGNHESGAGAAEPGFVSLPGES